MATAAAVAGVGLLALVLPPVLRRAQAILAARALFVPLLGNPYRRHDLRLSYALADRHRPRSVLRRASAAAPKQEEFHYSHAHLARLERVGDHRGIAAAYSLAGELARARQILEALLAEHQGTDSGTGAGAGEARRPGGDGGGPYDEAEPVASLMSDLAAVLAWDGKSHGRAQALELLDQALRRRPGLAQARWNRAVLLESLDLPLAAAHEFRAVGALGERGWSAEAATRAERLEKRWAHSLARHRAAAEAENALAGAAATLPAEELARAYPDAIRRGVYRGIRAAAGAAQSQRMVQIADWVDGLQGGGALGRLARKPALDPTLVALLDQQTFSEEGAFAFQKMAAEAGDPWLAIKAWVLIADVRRRQSAPEATYQALKAGLDLATTGDFPGLVFELSDMLCLVHTEARDLQQAQGLALGIKRESQARAMPLWELQANERLFRVEGHRLAAGLARTFAEENARQTLDPGVRWRAQHLLAAIARSESQLGEAKAHLRRLQSMSPPAGAPPFDYDVAALVQELIQRGETSDWPEAPALLRRTLAHYQADANLAGYRRAYLPIIRGRLLLADGDRQGGRRELGEALAWVANMKDGHAFRQRIVVSAYAAMVIDAATHGEHQRALEDLARLRGMAALPDGCLVGVVEEHQRRVFIVRGSDGRTSALIQPPEQASRPGAPAPSAVVERLGGCAQVAVVAAPPVFGQPGLLPADLPWAYQYKDPRPAGGGERRRLVVTDVRPPEALELPRLGPQPTAPTAAGEKLIALVGWEATPPRVLAAMPEADDIDLHVHGALLPQVSDVPALVFSPDANGDALLTLRELASLKLPRAPAVVLGACHAARGARYGSVHASLPGAFMAAGARLVFAAASPIEDSEAGEFFDAVRRRITAGAAPAAALRDERQSLRWRSRGPHWTRDVVLFQ